MNSVSTAIKDAALWRAQNSASCALSAIIVIGDLLHAIRAVGKARLGLAPGISRQQLDKTRASMRSCALISGTDPSLLTARRCRLIGRITADSCGPQMRGGARPYRAGYTASATTAICSS